VTGSYGLAQTRARAPRPVLLAGAEAMDEIFAQELLEP
jgi:hypothetical protein